MSDVYLIASILFARSRALVTTYSRALVHLVAVVGVLGAPSLQRADRSWWSSRAGIGWLGARGADDLLGLAHLLGARSYVLGVVHRQIPGRRWCARRALAETC